MSKRFALWLAIIIPIIFLVLIGLTTQLPKMWVKLKYNFIYSTANTYYSNPVEVRDGRILPKLNQPNYNLNSPLTNAIPELYLHDVATNRSRRIVYEDTSNLKLDGNSKSPDNWELKTNYSTPFFLNNSKFQQYLTNGWITVAQDLNGDNHLYSEPIFIAWVII